ncbi:MAG TPA: tyrosine-type recombinase/integrase [Pirellulales bacterium]|nr:tyrosine-type recombinase/integrase [Pirellulales bacterium]
MNAWIFQDHRQKQKLGDKCPWSVGWIDPEGKRKSKKVGAKSWAEKFARKIEGQLAAGTYETARKKSWSDFRKEFEERGMPGTTHGTKQLARFTFDHFERLVKPARVDAVTTRTIAAYVAARQAETHGKEMKRLSPATVNRELRNLRSIMRKAHKWGYLTKLPEFDFLKEPGRLPTYVTPEHFAKLYANAGAARLPVGVPFDRADWWRGLMVMAYMTGWRIGSLLALRWGDVDLEAGTAVSRAEDNKGKRDQRIPLHPLVVEHLRKLKSFSPVVFVWEHPRRGLFDEFHAIQKAAGVRPEGSKAFYGFHDLRRAFASLNAERMTADALQSLMQHRDYQTTQRYIAMARQLNPAVQNLYVPDLGAARA